MLFNPSGDVCSFFAYKNTTNTYKTGWYDLYFLAWRKEPQRKVGTCLRWEAQRGDTMVCLSWAALYWLRTNVPACDPYFRINEVCLRWRKQQGAAKDKDKRVTTILARKKDVAGIVFQGVKSKGCHCANVTYIILYIYVAAQPLALFFTLKWCWKWKVQSPCGEGRKR